MSENYYNKLQHLLKTQLELQTGTYKRMPNQKRLEMFNKEYQHFYDRVSVINIIPLLKHVQQIAKLVQLINHLKIV